MEKIAYNTIVKSIFFITIVDPHTKEVVDVFAGPLILINKTRISATKVELHMALDKNIFACV